MIRRLLRSLFARPVPDEPQAWEIQAGEPPILTIGRALATEAGDLDVPPAPSPPIDAATDEFNQLLAEEHAAAALPWDIRMLLADFETLGDSPEFGLLREKLHAGPDGLFGFATMYPAALVTLLANRFEGVGAPENLHHKVAWGYHYFSDERYGLIWRSNINADTAAADEAKHRESLRLTTLRQGLLDHLAAGSRLFVYAGAATEDQITAIRSAMRAHGNNALLYVGLADAEHPARSIERHPHGLLRGYLTRYGSVAGVWDLMIDDWVAICRAAHRLWLASPPT